LIKPKPGFSGKMFWILEIPLKTGFTVFKNEAFRNVTQYGLADENRRFLVRYCFHVQGVSALEKFEEPTRLPDTDNAKVYAYGTLAKQHFPAKAFRLFHGGLGLYSLFTARLHFHERHSLTAVRFITMAACLRKERERGKGRESDRAFHST
jgi:hypothetical protein